MASMNKILVMGLLTALFIVLYINYSFPHNSMLMNRLNYVKWQE